MSAAKMGIHHGPCTAERSAAISAAKRGVAQTQAHREANSRSHKGIPSSPSRVAAVVAALRGKKRPPFTDEWRERISLSKIGKRQSRETKIKRSLSLRRAYEEGRAKIVQPSQRYTTLAKALHAHLASMGLSLEPEVRFGRFTVDLYDREHHTAYEADGKYWHDKNEAEHPGRSAARDAYLTERFRLSVVHYDDAAIREMTRRVVA